MLVFISLQYFQILFKNVVCEWNVQVLANKMPFCECNGCGAHGENHRHCDTADNHVDDDDDVDGREDTMRLRLLAPPAAQETSVSNSKKRQKKKKIKMIQLTRRELVWNEPPQRRHCRQDEGIALVWMRPSASLLSGISGPPKGTWPQPIRKYLIDSKTL